MVRNFITKSFEIAEWGNRRVVRAPVGVSAVAGESAVVRSPSDEIAGNVIEY